MPEVYSFQTDTFISAPDKVYIMSKQKNVFIFQEYLIKGEKYLQQWH